MLNAAALIASESISGSRFTPPTRSVPSPNRALLLVPPRPVTDNPVTALQVHQNPRIPQSVLPNETRAAVPPVAWAKAPRTRAPGESPIRFFRFTEVDHPAAPRTEWSIDPEALDKLGLDRLAFEVLVNASGEIIGCTILDPPALADEIRNELEGKLRATPMTPADLDGRRVPSIRRIELYLTSD